MTRIRSLLAMAAVAVLVLGCGMKSPVDLPGLLSPKVSEEQKIEKLLDDVQDAMQARNVSRVMRCVSPDYHDEEGRDYTALDAFVTRIAKNYREVKITRVRPRVVVEGDRARALESFGTIATPFNSANHPRINVQGQVVVYLEKQGAIWRIVEWGRLR